MIQLLKVILNLYLSQYIGYSLCGIIYPYSLFILYIVACTSYLPTPHLPLTASLSPLVTSNLFSVSLFLFCYIHLLYILDSTYVITYFVFIWFISFNITLRSVLISWNLETSKAPVKYWPRAVSRVLCIIFQFKYIVGNHWQIHVFIH